MNRIRFLAVLAAAAAASVACTHSEGPPPPVPTPDGVPAARLSKGAAAKAGYWYVLRLTGFGPRTAVSVVCRDSVDPGGFKTFTVTTDAAGAAGTDQACFSGDGPDHWVTAGDTTSNKVSW